MKKKMYLTTPIYYVNGDPHVGHAHTSVMGDILSREYKMKNVDVFFTTGVDEHGQKNQTAIEDSGLASQEYLDKQSSIFSGLFDLLNVQYDMFVRTSTNQHKEAVRYVLEKVYQKGLIVKKEYEGLYCVGCEMFKIKSDLDDNGFCADHQTKPILMKENNYFFKLSEYQDWLIDYITTHPEWIQPEHYRKEILHLLSEPLPDLCISRSKERCWHGVELPFDKDYVAYVWFDALINYISSIGYPNIDSLFSERWSTCTHLMAKDIIKTHCIYWPIMLKAIDIEPQSRNLIHGYWTGAGGIKMSKTIGNVVDPYEVIQIFGVDAFRYFLARTMGENESSMSNDLIKSCYNTELTNTLSNALYRTLKLAEKKFNNSYPKNIQFRQEDNEFLETIMFDAKSVVEEKPSLRQIFNQAKVVYEIGRKINIFFDKCAPWTLAKEDDSNAFNSCIMTCIEAIRLMFEVAYPIMPNTSEKVLESLGVNSSWKENYKVLSRVLLADTKFDSPFILFKRMD